MRPQSSLRQLIQRQNVGPRPQRRIRKQDSAGEPLKQMRLVRIDAKVIHLDLGTRPGETRFALEDVWIAILFGEHDRLVARLSHAGGENDLYSFGRLQS